MEFLDVVWGRPVYWGLGRVSPGRVVEVGYGTGRGGKTHPGYWIWDSS